LQNLQLLLIQQVYFMLYSGGKSKSDLVYDEASNQKHADVSPSKQVSDNAQRNPADNGQRQDPQQNHAHHQCSMTSQQTSQQTSPMTRHDMQKKLQQCEVKTSGGQVYVKSDEMRQFPTTRREVLTSVCSFCLK